MRWRSGCSDHIVTESTDVLWSRKTPAKMHHSFGFSVITCSASLTCIKKVRCLWSSRSSQSKVHSVGFRSQGCFLSWKVAIKQKYSAYLLICMSFLRQHLVTVSTRFQLISAKVNIESTVIASDLTFTLNRKFGSLTCRGSPPTLLKESVAFFWLRKEMFLSSVWQVLIWVFGKY